MKKFLSIFISTALLFVFVIGIVACKKNEDEKEDIIDGTYPFEDETEETDYIGTDGLAYELSADGEYYICVGIGTATETEIVIAKEYNGKTVKEIKNEAFRENTLTSIVIPNSITKLGEQAFEKVKGLKKIKVPNSVIDMEDDMFYSCTELEHAVIGDNVKYIGNSAFSGCTILKSVVIGKGVKDIKESAFNYCKNLTAIGYRGTKAEWQAIRKGSDWKDQVPTTCKVYCTDGNVYI